MALALRPIGAGSGRMRHFDKELYIGINFLLKTRVLLLCIYLSAPMDEALTVFELNLMILEEVEKR
jgi:hypothetical protein